jgi:predicted transcriptional regulator
MTRITISLPNELASAVSREASRRRTSVSAVAREAIEARLGRGEGARRDLPFVALGRSGHRTTARDVDAILSAEWGDDRDR